MQKNIPWTSEKKGIAGLGASRFLLSWFYKQEKILYPLEKEEDENPLEHMLRIIDPQHVLLYMPQQVFFAYPSLKAFEEILILPKHDFHRLLLTKETILNLQILLYDLRNDIEYFQQPSKNKEAKGINEYIENPSLLLPPNEYVREPLSSLTIEDILENPSLLFDEKDEPREEKIDPQQLHVWHIKESSDEASLYFTVQLLIPKSMKTWRMLSQEIKQGVLHKKLKEEKVDELQMYLDTLLFSFTLFESIDEYFTQEWIKKGYNAKNYLISHPRITQKEMLTAFLFVHFHTHHKDAFFSLHPEKTKKILTQGPYIRGIHDYFFESPTNQIKKYPTPQRREAYQRGIITAYGIFLGLRKYLDQVKYYETNQE